MLGIYDKIKKNIEGATAIYIDTCSLLDYAADKFLYVYEKVIDDAPIYIHTYIHYKVKQELEKHASNTNKPELAERARIALGLIRKYLENKLFTMCGDVADCFADNALLNEINSKRLTENVFLFTEDKKLASDALQLTTFSSQKGFKVGSYGIHKMMANDFYHGLVVPYKSKSLKVTSVPDIGDIVIGEDGKKYELDEPVGNEGGEGCCYRVSSDKLVKIYHKEKLTDTLEAKVKYMISCNIKNPHIAWPLQCVYFNNKFVGYMMNEIKNARSLNEICTDRSDTIQVIKDKKQMIKLCLSLVDLVDLLHNKYILICDISPSNILFRDNDVYLIDTDSFQIEQYPSNVNTPGYFCPEYIDDKYHRFLPPFRDENSELYVLARLLFQLIMNIDPYSTADGSVEDEFKKIKEGKFPYPLKSREHGGDYSYVPRDNSMFIWDSLSDEIRATFFNIFSKEFGLYANPVKRPSARKWHHIFNSYLKYLNSLNPNHVDLQLFPTTFDNGENNKVKDEFYNKEYESRKSSFEVQDQLDYMSQRLDSVIKQAYYLNSKEKSNLNDEMIPYFRKMRNANNEKKASDVLDEFNKFCITFFQRDDIMEKRVNNPYLINDAECKNMFDAMSKILNQSFYLNHNDLRNSLNGIYKSAAITKEPNHVKKCYDEFLNKNKELKNEFKNNNQNKENSSSKNVQESKPKTVSENTSKPNPKNIVKSDTQKNNAKKPPQVSNYYEYSLKFKSILDGLKSIYNIDETFKDIVQYYSTEQNEDVETFLRKLELSLIKNGSFELGGIVVSRTRSLFSYKITLKAK